jgi:hypothetical protein
MRRETVASDIENDRAGTLRIDHTSSAAVKTGNGLMAIARTIGRK